MNEVLFSESPPIMVLPALTAADLMTPNPVSLADVATVKEAIAFLIDKGIGGAPVIDEAGRPVGVLTQHDIVVHDRETVSYFTPDRDYMDAGTPLGRHLEDDFLLENVDRTQIRDLMTPVIFSVRLDTPAAKVIEEMVNLKIHRLYVVDDIGVLVGVVTALDVLRNLHVHRPD
ncbi:MAG: HPP family protein [Gemmataceae bacterium]